MKRYAYILLSIIVALAGCEPQLPDSPDMLVIEGWIENDAVPVVFVTSSVSASFDEMDMSDLIGHVAINATVTITHNGVTYPLTPTVRNDYLLKYCYTSSTLKGTVGGTYQLDVDWKGMHASAVTTIQTPGSVDSIVIERHQTIDSLYVLKVHPVPAPDVHYYQFFSWDVNKEPAYTASYMGVYDSWLNGTDLIAVNRGMDNPFTRNDYFYAMGDSVRFKIASLEPIAYEFWRKFDENRQFSHTSLLPYTTNLKSNITGGLGYFFGYGVSNYSLTIKK
ncbi:MAG: DUF4249 family protein [Bacteroidaceae bacterium]|nr:DUF4249 family protein [Bacteroidaceae bacterium]